MSTDEEPKPGSPEEFARRAAAFGILNATEKDEVQFLGDAIGYGRLMQLASQIWAEKDPDAAHVVGPCRIYAVPCGCSDGMCDWCCGAGWVTPAVKVAKIGKPERIPKDEGGANVVG